MVIAIVILAGMGVLLCSLWIGQIRDFKDLNSAKFEVLNMMAPLIRFGADQTLVSARPFEQEWSILDKKKATREVDTMEIVALRSSNAELLVPRAFRWLFALITAASIITTVVNWPTLMGSVFDLRQPTTSSPSTGVKPK